MHGLLAALSFLTTILVPEQLQGKAGVSPRPMLWWWGVVGGLIGVLAAAVVWVAHLRLPWIACAALGVVALVVLSGGLHLDGFADTCDGAGSRAPRERALAIMKDSRTGAFGVIGIVCLLLVKFSLLTGLAPSWGVAALGSAPVAGRLAQIWVLCVHPYARAEGGMAGVFFSAATWWHVLVNMFVAVVIVLAWLQLAGIVALACAMLLGGICAVGIAHWLKGHTGDTVGAISEITEVAMILMLAIIYGM
ncbi:MAG: adenosylcobinamide-GDP ribazoletransferase [Anaerolineae bacterium]